MASPDDRKEEATVKAEEDDIASSSSLFLNDNNNDNNTLPPPSSHPLPPPTLVNGIGLWNSWTRNFKSPLLAFLDLLDNAVDAAFVPAPAEAPQTDTLSREKATVSFEGKIQVLADRTISMSRPCPNLRTGIILINNSHQPIKNLGEILEVYHSTKHRAAESVGENGVGLKQGCAALCDLSFVVARYDTEIYLGILSKRLQSVDGCCLPSYHLGSIHTSQQQQIPFDAKIRLRGQEHVELQQCLSDYGGGDVELGIERLAKRISMFSNDPVWASEPHVFMLILNRLKHATGEAEAEKDLVAPASDTDGAAEYTDAAKNNIKNNANETTDRTTTRHYLASQAEPFLKDDTSLDACSVRTLFEKLQRSLPRQYIHIPSSFHFLLDGRPLRFEYWQRHLVEMTRFSLNIFRNIRFDKDPKWDAVEGRDPKDWYQLTVYCGFDAERAKTMNKGNAKLFTYSRRSGRLICTEEDPRSSLSLAAGSSQFSQGLVIIIDDFEGNLPLNPTKQDIAFGEETKGNIHKKNLYAWVGAAVWTYWMKCFDDNECSKDVLTESIKDAYHPNRAKLPQMPSIGQCDFSTISHPFPGKMWTVYKSAFIRPHSRHNLVVNHGKDTLWRLPRIPKGSPVKAKGTPGPPKKKRKTDSGVSVDAETAAPRAATPPPAHLAGLVLPTRRPRIQLAENSRRPTSQNSSVSSLKETHSAAEWKKMLYEANRRILDLEEKLGDLEEDNNTNGKLRNAKSQQKSDRMIELEEQKRLFLDDNERMRKDLQRLHHMNESLKKEQTRLQAELQGTSTLTSNPVAKKRNDAQEHSNEEGKKIEHLKKQLKNTNKLTKALRAENASLRQQLEISGQQGAASSEDEEW